VKANRISLVIHVLRPRDVSFWIITDCECNTGMVRREPFVLYVNAYMNKPREADTLFKHQACPKFASLGRFM